MDTFSDKEIVFDCGNINFIRPLGLNILALLIRSLLQQESSTIFFACPTDLGCEQYFNDQGFYKEFRLGDRDKAIKASPRSTSIGLRRMEVFEPFYLQQIAQWLNRNLSLPEEIITDAVTIPLSEIILNVVDHSQSSMGCYICAQSYPQEKKLMLSVADCGVGFLETLRPRYTSLSHESQDQNAKAIALAVQEGISSKSRGSNAGAGLYILSDFLKQRGNVEIISKDGVWRQNADGTTLSRTIPFAFPGSCVNVEFDNQKIMDLRFQGDDE